MKIDSDKIIKDYKEAFKAANGFNCEVRYAHGRFYFETGVKEAFRLNKVLEFTAVLKQRVRNKELDKVESYRGTANE